ncbi:hypothetical protein BP6252_11789 [Coleophoma cylindrospora]|uniref:Zn(2)-C6 fungal-type domain-containing protein n=1 Tax=Coleophoma cylindrospora TaxID=1849047 RepID=A0A3D8QKK3_9HELO|nr:hypothetical protein BP6252_11789 [Coleophoma cylindrospora]
MADSVVSQAPNGHLIDSSLVKKPGRAGRPKVRTGCITCKIRRIKCGEEKPHCQRCTSTGRKCDGYPAPKKATDTTSAPQPPAKSTCRAGLGSSNRLLDYHGTLQELRSFEYFLRQTAPSLAGWFDECFWTVQLPQTSQLEPTVRHAMIAVASVHEQMEAISEAIVGHRKPDSVELDAQRRFSFLQYNTAMAALRGRISDATQPTELTLSCCVLFICIEFIRGNFTTAVLHLHNGLQILSKWRKTLPLEKLTPLSLEDNLIRIFERLAFQSILTDKPLSHLHPKISTAEILQGTETDTAFPSFILARYALDHVVKEAFGFIRRGEEKAFLPDSSPEKVQLYHERQSHVDKFEQWSSKFESFVSKRQKSMTVQETQGADDMRILQQVALLWLETSLSTAQEEFDKHMDKFENIIQMCEVLSAQQIQDASKRATRSRYFSFEMGLLPPIFFVAMKCRHRVLRRRALALLQVASPRREGMWNAGLLAAVAEKTVALEEEGMDPDAMFPPERQRVLDTSGMPNKEGTSYSRLGSELQARHEMELDLGPREQVVAFVLRPDGVDGRLEVRELPIRWQGTVGL